VKDKTADELITVEDYLRFAATRFSASELFFGHGTDNAWDEALSLVCGYLGLPWDKLEWVLSGRLTTGERKDLARLIERRISERVPVPYLIGEAWFAGFRFLVEPGVLIPRSPIAELIDKGFEPWLSRDPVRVLDLGTGSGCIGIACALLFAEARVTLVDIDERALDLAARNVALHGVGDRVSLVRSDLFDEIPDGSFDLIVANPPYVDAEDLMAMPAEYQHEPVPALAAGADGLDLVRRILAGARDYLSADGVLVVEVGNSAGALVEAFPTMPFVWPDFSFGGHGVFILDKAGLGAGLSATT
jgi:ribosomal protein L3 glutamine methyltransferase